MASPTEEEYLRAFYYLEKKNGRVRTSVLASYLGVSRAGVSEMFASLSRKGLLRFKPYEEASLTKKGRLIARKMTFKHRVLEVFLSRKLGMEAASVHEEASHMEHAISDSALLRLYRFLGKPKYDPHGSPISR